MPLKPRPLIFSLSPTFTSLRLTPKPTHNPAPHPLRKRTITSYGYTPVKSLLFSSPGPPATALTLHTHSLPPVHSDLLTLRTLAAPLNPADYNQVQGTYPSLPPPPPPSSSEPQSQHHHQQPSPPLTGSTVPGNEACFEVLATGPAAAAAGWEKGDWALPLRTGLGTWRTALQAHCTDVLKVGREVRDAAARGQGTSVTQVAGATVNPLTAWRLLRDFAELREGAWWMQNAANSAVGRAAVQLGRRWGLRSINVVRERAGLKEELLGLGADVVVDEAEVKEKGFGERVKGWTGGEGGVGLGLNCVGGDSALAVAKTLRPGATLVTYGAMARQPLRVPASLLIFKDIRFQGFWVSKWGEEHPREKQETLEAVLQMMKESQLKEGPVERVKWAWETGKEELVGAVEGIMEGGRGGKGVFVFEGT
ncbi:MAG: hypothetical protein LQ342_005970 [Letrouitia transgressa]|nr:MAG: hypothetical protein LQ342_005970 [Letrouitia transgressa]